MTPEIPERETAKQLILPAIRQRLDSVGSDSDFVSDFARSHPGTNYLASEVRTLGSLAIACVRLDLDPGRFRKLMWEKWTANKAGAMEYGDIITAIETDEAYIDFLMKSGSPDEAINMAFGITDGYFLPDPDGIQVESTADLLEFLLREYQQSAFNRKRSGLLSAMAWHFLHEGDLEHAGIILDDRQFAQDSLQYYPCRLNYYLQTNQTGLRDDLLQTIEYSLAAMIRNSESEFRYRTLRTIVDSARKDEIKQAFEENRIDEAFRLLQNITVAGHRIYLGTELLSELVPTGNFEKARKITGYLLKEIHIHSAYVMDSNNDEDEDESPVGTIGGRIPESDYRFIPEETLNLRIEIARILAPYPELFPEFVNAVDGDGTRASWPLENLLSVCRLENRQILNLMLFAAKSGDRGSRDDYYRRAKELYPDDPDIDGSYALTIAAEDPDRAEALIRSMTNPRRRLDRYAGLYLNRLWSSPSLSGWREIITSLTVMERDLSSPQHLDIDWESLDVESNVDEEYVPNDIPASDITTSGPLWFSRGDVPEFPYCTQIPGFLYTVAEAALHRGEYAVYGDILNDPRLDNAHAARLILTTAAWIRNEQEWD